MNEQRLARALALLLAIGTLLVYWPARHFEFTNYDDEDYVYRNPMVMKGLTAEGVRWAFTTGHMANWHPLTWLSHMLDCQLWGVNPGAHHMMSVLVHVMATVALFFALRRMTKSATRSAMVAALFAVHPLHVESVAWVAERKDVLSGLFWMLTMWAYVWYSERPGAMRYLLVLVAFALGLMAKPMLVTLPCVLLLLDHWPLKRGLRWLEKAPLFALSAASSVVTLIVQREGGAVFAFAEKLSLGGRVANAFVAYVSYLGKMVLPEELAVLYPHPGHWPLWQVAGAVVIMAAITVAVVVFGKVRPYLQTGWLWYLGTLVPVIGLVQVGEQYMADRYTYIPLIGVFIALVWAAADLLAALPQRKVAMGFAVAIVLAGCVAGSRRQLAYWENSMKLFARTVQVTAGNPTARYNLAQALSVRGHLKESMPHYEEALRLRPEYPDALNNLGFTLALMGRLTEATNYYEKAARYAPRMASAHINYGFALLNLAQPERAVPHFESAVKEAPGLPIARLGYGRALLAAGKADAGIAQLREALRLQQNYAEAEYHLGRALVERGQTDEGLEHIQRAVRLAPQAPDARSYLGWIYATQRKTAEAIAEYKEALRLNANNPETLNNYAWLLATHPDGQIRNGHLAVELGERACELTQYQVPLFVGTLAATYAEVGRFDEAIKTATTARELAAARGQEELVKKNTELIALYRSKQPHREN